MAIINPSNNVTTEYLDVIPYYVQYPPIDAGGLRGIFETYMMNDRYEYIRTGNSQKIDEFYWDILQIELAQHADISYQSDYLTPKFISPDWTRHPYFTGSITNPVNESTIQFRALAGATSLVSGTRIETFATESWQDIYEPTYAYDDNRINVIYGTKTALGQTFRYMPDYIDIGSISVLEYKDSAGKVGLRDYDTAYVAKYLEYWGDQQWKKSIQFFGYYCVLGYIPPTGTLCRLPFNMPAGIAGNVQVFTDRWSFTPTWVRGSDTLYTLTAARFPAARILTLAIGFEKFTTTSASYYCTLQNGRFVRQKYTAVCSLHLVMTHNGLQYYWHVRTTCRNLMEGNLFTDGSAVISNIKATWQRDKYTQIGYHSPVPSANSAIAHTINEMTFNVSLTTDTDGLLNGQVQITLPSGYQNIEAQYMRYP
jgi:hypothetical protein